MIFSDSSVIFFSVDKNLSFLLLLLSWIELSSGRSKEMREIREHVAMFQELLNVPWIHHMGVWPSILMFNSFRTVYMCSAKKPIRTNPAYSYACVYVCMLVCLKKKKCMHDGDWQLNSPYYKKTKNVVDNQTAGLSSTSLCKATLGKQCFSFLLFFFTYQL